MGLYNELSQTPSYPRRGETMEGNGTKTKYILNSAISGQKRSLRLNRHCSHRTWRCHETTDVRFISGGKSDVLCTILISNNCFLSVFLFDYFYENNQFVTFCNSEIIWNLFNKSIDYIIRNHCKIAKEKTNEIWTIIYLIQTSTAEMFELPSSQPWPHTSRVSPGDLGYAKSTFPFHTCIIHTGTCVTGQTQATT